jgi:hypothetical protein
MEEEEWNNEITEEWKNGIQDEDEWKRKNGRVEEEE